MDDVLLMQYRRGSKRLQVIILPWAGKFSISALIRFSDQHTTDAARGWRYFPAHGMSITLAVGENERFVADAAVEAIIQSQWTQHGAVLEIKEIGEMLTAEAGELRRDHIPKSLFKRISDEVDNWA